MKSLASTCAIPVMALLAACGGGGGGDGGGGTGGTAASLPTSAAPVVHDTRVVALNATSETLVGESEPVLSAPEDVTYPYDPAKPDEANPAETTVRLRSLCTTRTYDMVSNPEKVAMYSADGNVSFPGALLRGDAFRAGQLRKLGVRPDHRTPVTFVINNVYSQSGSTSGTVPQPDLQPVQDAVKARIVQAFNDNIPIGDSVAFSYEETSDISRFMLKAKISAKYGGISGALGTKISKQSSERSVVIHLTQKLFDVEVQQPPTRNDWFAPDFFDSGLKPLLDSGEMSTTDAPVYVSRVTYGRVLTFTLTSTASRSDIEAMLRASVKTLVASGSLQMDAKSTNINKSKKITVAQIGGVGAAAITAAESGDWGAFFKQKLQLTEAAPILVEYRNLYDNSPAGVTENTQATEEVCTPQIVVPGPFDFALEDSHERPAGIGAVQQVASGDFNGDGISDVVWNELAGNTNRLYVGYGNKTGRLSIEPKACAGQACDFSDPLIGWGQFKLKVGDFNGDGRDDLMWLQASANHFQISARVLLAAAGGGFAGPLHALGYPLDTTTRAGMRPDAIVADMNNDGRDDLLLWFTTRNAAGQNLVDQLIVRSDIGQGNTPFVPQARTRVGAYTDNFNTDPATAPLYMKVADVNSDGWNDLLLMLVGQSTANGVNFHNNVATPFLNSKPPAQMDASFVQGVTFIHSGRGWGDYLPLVADFNGDGTTDAAWINRRAGTSASPVGAVHQAAYNLGTGRFDEQGLQMWNGAPTGIEVNVPRLLRDHNDQIFVLDTNGDAAQDMVATRFLLDSSGRLTLNGIAVTKGVSGASPMFDVRQDAQTHPVRRDWTNHTWLLTGDFNGDGLQDVLWNNAALDNSSFIAFAKRDETQSQF